MVIQLTVFWDHVDLNIPYWYTGAKADAVFQQLAGYLQVIREVAGFFVYDPQKGRAFDPINEHFGSHEDYERISENLPAIVAQGVPKKPWWKFW